MIQTDEQIAEKQIKDYLSQDQIEIILSSFEHNLGTNERELIVNLPKGFISLEVVYDYTYKKEHDTNSIVEDVNLIEIAEGYFCMDYVSVYLTSEQLLEIQEKAVLFN